MKTLNFHPKDVYGRRLYYPLDTLARGFCQFLGAKTLNQTQLDALKGLGYEINLNYEDQTNEKTA